MKLQGHQNIFVVSDLHLGDGSSFDPICKSDRYVQLLHLLDYMDRENGQLVILGDLLELWRFSLSSVMNQWHGLLDRFDQMNAIYVLGNHDEKIADIAPDSTNHPFLKRACQAFTHKIGDHTFRFMHGHEVDPLIPDPSSLFNGLLRRLSRPLIPKQQTCLLANDAFSDFLLESGEQMLRIWHRLSRNIHAHLHDELVELFGEPERTIRRIRTEKMLNRFCHHRDQEYYDIAIAGHTHQAGRFGRWYYNSGCWTKKTNSFLRIHPDGHVEVFDWDRSGAHPNLEQLGYQQPVLTFEQRTVCS